LAKRIRFLRCVNFELASDVNAERVGIARFDFDVGQVGIERQRTARFHRERLHDVVTEPGAGVSIHGDRNRHAQREAG
jgi:hypothetical protein